MKHRSSPSGISCSSQGFFSSLDRHPQHWVPVAVPSRLAAPSWGWFCSRMALATNMWEKVLSHRLPMPKLLPMSRGSLPTQQPGHASQQPGHASHQQAADAVLLENGDTSTVASPPPCFFLWGYKAHLVWLILQHLLEKRNVCVCVHTHMLMHARTPETSMTIQPQLLGGPPQALVHLQVRGDAENCHPHKGLQLPSVCGEMGMGFGKDEPLFPSSSTDGKPEPQRERLSCSEGFQCFLPVRAAPCQLPTGGGAREPWLLLASLASHADPGWRQHAEHWGANGHNNGRHCPCPPVPPQAPSSLRSTAAGALSTLPDYTRQFQLAPLVPREQCPGSCCPPKSASVDLATYMGT